MRISELAEVTGVPVPTIKYYLREGLLPPGRKVSDRLSEYDEQHARRLGLLRILRVIGDLPVEKLRAVVDGQCHEARPLAPACRRPMDVVDRLVLAQRPVRRAVLEEILQLLEGRALR